MHWWKKILLVSGLALFVFVASGFTFTYWSLANTSWRFERLILNNENQTIYVSSTPQLRFEGLEVIGNDGCNKFTMGYLPSNFGYFHLGPYLIKTLEGCAIVTLDEAGEVETRIPIEGDRFTDTLQQAYRFEIDGRVMNVYLRGGDPNDRLVFTRLP